MTNVNSQVTAAERVEEHVKSLRELAQLPLPNLRAAIYRALRERYGEQTDLFYVPPTDPNALDQRS